MNEKCNNQIRQSITSSTRVVLGFLLCAIMITIINFFLRDPLVEMISAFFAYEVCLAEDAVSRDLDTFQRWKQV